MQKTVWDKFKGSYYLDYRAMALARILIAGVLIFNLIVRLSNLEVFYTVQGILPLQLLFEKEWNPYSFSFHTMSSLWVFQAFLFFTALVFASMMLLGYSTKLATFMSWMLLLSADNRNPLILQGGDDLLRITLFIAMFLPWHLRYSVDSIKNKYITKGNLFPSFSGLTYLLLIGSVYLFSALLKTSAEWHEDGTALYYALNLDQLTWPAGRWLLQYPDLIKFLTQFTWYLEVVAPALLIIPFIHKVTRPIGVALIISLHLGISATLFVGLFWIIGITTSIACLPSNIMDFLEVRFQKIIILIKSFFVLIANKLPSFTTSEWSKNLSKKLFDFKEVVLILYTLFFITNNINNLHVFTYKIGDAVTNTAHFFRITQNWGMFAPSVFKDDGWYIYEATPVDAPNDSIIHKIDIYRNAQPVNYNKPDNVLKWIKDDRWRKYSENYLFTSKSYIRPPLCNYLHRVWNENNPEQQIGKLQIIYMKEITQAPDSAYVPATREMLCECN